MFLRVAALGLVTAGWVAACALDVRGTGGAGRDTPAHTGAGEGTGGEGGVWNTTSKGGHSSAGAASGGAPAAGGRGGGGAGGASSCGNGALDPGETCDDGGTKPWDGCSADCQVEDFGSCSGTSISLAATHQPLEVLGTLDGKKDHGTAQCAKKGPGQPDAIHQVVPLVTGSLRVAVTMMPANGTASIFDACDFAKQHERACTGTQQDSTPILVEQGVPVWVLVDGDPGKNDAHYTLRLTLSTCGNGVIDPDEQCDDGNLEGSDGCAPNCTVECTCPKDVHCDNGGLYVDMNTSHCYARTSDGGRSFDDAAAVCKAWGGTLAAPTLPAELDDLTMNLQPLDVWIGARDTTGKNQYAWSTGEPFSYVPMKGPWAAGEPNNPGLEGCVELYGSGQLNNLGCGTLLRFVCERNPPEKYPK